MRRSGLLVAAALVAATATNVVLWAAYRDASGYAGKLAGRLAASQSALKRAQLDVVALLPDHPGPHLFEPKVFPLPVEDPALEVSGG